MSRFLESYILNFYWHYITFGIVTSIFTWAARNYYNTTRKNPTALQENNKYLGPTKKNETNTIVEKSVGTENANKSSLEFTDRSAEELSKRSESFYRVMSKRRTVRFFKKTSFPIEVIHNIVKTAGTSPSGAHMQPWTYVVVRSLEFKKKIREIVEREEEINYKNRMGDKWTADLETFETNWIKEYITEAPYIILVFKQIYGLKENGEKQIHYYTEISVSISAGLLISAVHYAGLATVTSTPLNCGPAIRSLLQRPKNEKLILLLPVGYPIENCQVPQLERKPLQEICVEI